MNAWKVILATLVIFIAGLITGALLIGKTQQVERAVASVDTNQTRSVTGLPGATPWQIRNRELVRRMDRELDLTPGQRDQIEKIIATSQERTRALWKPILPLMSKETQAVHAEIRDLLTADQKKKFDGFAKARPALEKHRADTNSISNSPTNSASVNSSNAP